MSGWSTRLARKADEPVLNLDEPVGGKRGDGFLVQELAFAWLVGDEA